MYARLASLTLCNQTALAAQEVKALEDLNSAYYRDENDGKHLVPWELRVLAVRLQGMGFNDARRGVVGYYDLAREARLMLSSLKQSRREMKTKVKTPEGDEDDDAKGDKETEKLGELEQEIQIWDHRLAELGIRVASALIEMEDLEGATRFLASLTPSPSSQPASPFSTSHLSIQKALLWLCIGDVEAARSCVRSASSGSESGNDEQTISNEQKVILALANMADSDFEKAVDGWRDLIDTDTAEEGEKAMWRQNLGVCYLYLGRMDEVRVPILFSFSDSSHRFLHLRFPSPIMFIPSPFLLLSNPFDPFQTNISSPSLGTNPPRIPSQHQPLLPRPNIQPLHHLRTLHRAQPRIEDRIGGKSSKYARRWRCSWK